MIDRATVTRDAHKRFRAGRRLGLDWSFGRCLITAWAAGKARAALAEAGAGRGAFLVDSAARKRTAHESRLAAFSVSAIANHAARL